MKYADPLPADELHALIRLAQGGDQAARNRVLECNLKLVSKHARALARSADRWDMLDELIQAGAVGYNGPGGLLRAIERFDPARAAWTTYASFWVRGPMLAALAQTDVAGRSIAERHAVAQRIASELQAASGERPDAAAVRAEMRRRGMTAPSLGMVHQALNAPIRVLLLDLQESLDDGGVGGGGGMGGVAVEVYRRQREDDVLESEAAVAEACDHERTLQRLAAAKLDVLSERERDVIRERYTHERTYAEIGALLQIGRTRVHQIEAAALAKLRGAMRAAA